MDLLIRTALAVMLVLAGCSAASAQDAGYVSGAAFADVRQFGSSTSSTTLFGGQHSEDATAAGGSLRIGTWVHPRWTLELGADVTGRTTETITGPVIAIFPPVPPLEMTTGTRLVGVTTLVGFHSAAGRRIRWGYLAGFSFVRTTYTTALPDIYLPQFSVPRSSSLSVPARSTENATRALSRWGSKRQSRSRRGFRSCRRYARQRYRACF